MDNDTKQKMNSLLEDIFNHSLMVVNSEADMDYVLTRIEKSVSKAMDLLDTVTVTD